MIKDAKTPDLEEERPEAAPDVRGRDLSALSTSFAALAPDLKSIMDAPKIQSLMDDFFNITGIGVAVIDTKGEVLVAAGWQDICTKFHRKHPETLRNCVESDTFLTKNVVKGQFLKYKCKNNLWDVVTPICIGDEHLGNLFFGQFFYEGETPDYEFFLRQADRFGFDKASYLAALDRVPRWSEERIDTIMRFYVKLTTLISQLGYSNIILEKENLERQMIESALREKEYFVNRILSTDPNGILIYDVLTDRVVFVNPKCTEIFGLMPDEFAALSEVMSTAVHPEDLARAKEANERAVKGRDDDVQDLEVRVRRQDDWIWAHVYAVPFLRDKEGRVVQVLVTVQDVTDRRRAEEELRRTNDKLNLLNSITRHDINNQLLVLAGNLHMLRSKETHPNALVRLANIERSAEMIREQIEFTKDYQDMGATSPQWQDLRALLEGLPVTKEVGYLDLNDRLHGLSVYADPMLYKVFHNLIEDSIRYGARPTNVRIDCQPRGADLLLVYEDIGPGLTAEEKERLFQKGCGKGTGFGLFLSREILSITGITIKETGETGKGVRFEILIKKGRFSFADDERAP